jgi:colanic acid/amylovoran biosynthesis glycosyltransferase
VRIAVIVGQFPALSETFISRQITGLLDRGHDVEIFAHSAGKDPFVHTAVEKYGLLARTCYLDAYASSPSRIARFAKRLAWVITSIPNQPRAVLRSLNPIAYGKPALSLAVFNQILPFLSRPPYDLVHCHFGPNGNLGVLLRDAACACRKVITTFHGYDVSSYTRVRGPHVYSELFARGDLFLCVSERIKKKLIALGCPEQKILVHRCGVDMAEFRRSSSEPNTNARVSVLTVARLVEKKGVEDGIRAVTKLLKKHDCIDYKIVGDGPLKADLQKLIEELQAGKNITLLGWRRQEEIVELLRQAEIFLAPSVTGKTGDEEGIPVTLMEALAQSLPVVSTAHAGIPELVQDGESGFLVPEGDPDALAERLERLVADPELRSRMGRNGRRAVEEHYNIDQLNDRLVEIYQQLVQTDLCNTAPVRLPVLPENSIPDAIWNRDR